MIDFKINGKAVRGDDDETVLSVAKRYGIEIPTFCYHKALEPSGACRLCIVEVTKEEWEGWKNYVVSCVYPIAKDILVTTHSPEVVEIRRTIVELLLARCPESKELRALASEYGIAGTNFISSEKPELRDNCILCGLCTRICQELGFSAISVAGRGHSKVVAPPLGESPQDCTGCASCARICPTNNIPFKVDSGKLEIWDREFEMIACKTCKRTYISKDFAQALMKKKGVPLEYFNLCDECRKKKTVSTMYGLTKWDKGGVK